MRPLAALAVGCLLVPGIVPPAGVRAQEADAPPSASSDGAARRSSAPPAAIRILDVPFVPQEEDLCGGAATAMVLRHWGLHGAEATDFVGLVERDRGGIVADRLVAEVRRRGWNVVVASATPDELAGHVLAGRPAVVLLRSGPDAFHYVTVVGVAGEHFVVHDPARNPFRVLRRDELRRRRAPSDGWTMVVWPAEETVSSPGAPDERPAAAEPASLPAAAEAPGAASCGRLVEVGVREARRGRGEAAQRLLGLAVARCPSDPAPHRELAGLAVRRGAWDRVGERARAALARTPDDALSLRLLASSLYARDSARRALEVWNRLGEPRISGLRGYGLDRTRFEVLRRHLALDHGGLLTPAKLVLVRRRALALPALRRVRPEYVPPSSGTSEVAVAVRDGPLLPSPGRLALVNGLRALVDREAGVTLYGPARAGDRLSLSGRWHEPRARAGGAYAAPGAAGIPGVWEAALGWSRQTFALDGDAPGSGEEAGPGGVPGAREEVLSGRLSWRRWATPGLRWGASLGYDRWLRAGEGPVGGASLGWREPGGRLAARGRSRVRWGLARGPVGGFDVEIRARTALSGAGFVLRGRAGWAAVGTGAPRSLWPGAGVGRAREVLLRAHPLLEGGVVTDGVFGRRLLHAGVEIRTPSVDVGPLGASGAAFLDGAAASERAGDRGGLRAEADVGIGLRLDVPGLPAGLRLDAAAGLRDGATALSAGWTTPWPGWE